MLIKDDYGHPIFTSDAADGFTGKLLGSPYVIDDYVPTNTFLFGCFDYYYMNFAKAPTIDVSREGGIYFRYADISRPCCGRW